MEKSTFSQILEKDESIIAQKAAKCGINWYAIKNSIIPHIDTSFQDNIEIDKKDKGRVKVWVQCKYDEFNIAYPFITFHNFNDGGISESYTGINSIS